MKEFWSGLPTWAKGVVGVVSVVAIGGLGFAIYRGIKKAIEKAQEGKGDKEFKSETKQELQQLAQQGIQPTMPDSTALSLSSFVQERLGDFELSGTEKQVVNEILAKVNNQADWLKLQNTFGVRPIDNDGPSWITGSTNKDLKGVLQSDLDGWDSQNPFNTDPNKKYINILKNGLQAKGITW
jgi:hypothetical protein